MKVDLGGVPETLLWTLWYRAGEARRPDAVIDDPRAVELVDAIDYPFEQRFGPASGPAAQWQALRAMAFDEAVRDFLRVHRGGTVVALGEGLETGFWRTDDGAVRWLTVDLPETIAVRRALLPPGPRRRTLARSATDHGWMDAVDAAHGVLITAQGLFMYLPRDDVHALIAACAARFPGAALVFDTAPFWFAGLARRGLLRTPGYTAPPRPWGMDPLERRRLAALPGVRALADRQLPRGRGPVFEIGYPLLERLPLARELTMAVLEARF
jgi:O-methyltransferase involved in polyketide biosynthesis